MEMSDSLPRKKSSPSSPSSPSSISPTSPLSRPLPPRRLSSSIVNDAEENLALLFRDVDRNHDGFLSQEEFVSGLEAMPFVDISEVEARRLFESIDGDSSGTITLQEFVEAARNIRWIRTLVRIYRASKEYHFIVPEGYDYTKSTTQNYKEANQVYVGDYADIRATRDYSWHSNYVVERQNWQDGAIRCCLGRTESQPRPWVIFTCGPMGVGKGHVLSWMSSQGLFPLEYIVHVDPDYFKRIMPEWDTYVNSDEETAGTLCHQESAYLQEIAQEVAMRQRQHVWVDGSLSDGPWFLKVFQDIRERFPHYRIAIIHINAPEATIRSRIAKRTKETGRNIPESAIQRSLQSPERSLQLLAPKTDLVVRIWNDTQIILRCVEDHSGNWHRSLGKHFGTISHQPLKFPSSLGPFYLEATSFRGSCFQKLNQLTKEGILRIKSDIGDWESLWFNLAPGGQLSAHRLTNVGQLQFLHTWEVNEETILEANSQITPPIFPVSANATKKRNYTASFQGSDTEKQNDLSFELSFTVPSTIYLNSSSYNLTSPLITESKTIYLAAFDQESKLQWLEIIQKLIDVWNENETDEDEPIFLHKTQTNPQLRQGMQRSETATSTASHNRHTVSECYESLTLSPLQCQNSPVLFQLLWKLSSPILFTASPLFRVEGKTEELELSGVPRGTTHSRFVFANDETSGLDFSCLDVDISDPDILFLTRGGFIHYDRLGHVLGAMALSQVDTQYFIQYSPPEKLHSEDANHLSCYNRWKKITRGDLLAEGAKYVAFVCPHEQLATRRFPSHGSFVYLFREPSEQSDERDCYFTPLMTY